MPVSGWPEHLVRAVPHALWPFRGPGREDEADGNDGRKHYRQDEKVPPTQERDCTEARRETPSHAWHRRQPIFGQASELPRQDCDEDQKDSNEKPETSVEVPIGAVQSLNVETSGSQRRDNRIYPPMWIDSTEAQRVPHREEDQQAGGDAIK